MRSIVNRKLSSRDFDIEATRHHRFYRHREGSAAMLSIPRGGVRENPWKNPENGEQRKVACRRGGILVHGKSGQAGPGKSMWLPW